MSDNTKRENPATNRPQQGEQKTQDQRREGEVHNPRSPVTGDHKPSTVNNEPKQAKATVGENGGGF